MKRLVTRLYAPVDIASIALFRIAFGAVMVAWVALGVTQRWIEDFFTTPTFHFTFLGFGWVHPWPGRGMTFHLLALGVLAAGVCVGLAYRCCIVLFALGFTYLWLCEATFFQNHLYLISLFAGLLCFVPAHRALSVDAALRPALRSDSVPAWTVWVLRLQIAAVYFYAGLAKLDTDWLHGQPMRLTFTAMGSHPLFGDLITRPWFGLVASRVGLVTDLTIAPLLLWRRTRLVAFVAAVFFHLLNATLWDIDIFPWLAIAATTLFFSPDWPRRVFPMWRRRMPAEREALVTPRRVVGAAALGIYVAVQALMPLRHLLYPGRASWTEEGHRFAWRMFLRSKYARARFLVESPQGGGSQFVDPAQELSPWQVKVMAGNPDMLLQYAHHLADRYRAQGQSDVQVHAIVSASLNGRPAVPFVDPRVDLAAEQRSLLPKRWVLPLVEPLPD